MEILKFIIKFIYSKGGRFIEIILNAIFILSKIKVIFNTRFFIALCLVVVSVLFLLPLPWEKEQMFFWGYHENGVVINFPEMIRRFSFMDIFLSSINLPSRVKHYDVHFINKSPISLEHDLIFKIELHDNSLFGAYAKKFFGGSNRYNLYSGNEKDITAVPIEIPISYSSIPFCFGKGPSGCTETWFMMTDKNDHENPQDMQVYVTPNFFSWLMQLLLIFAFWVVVINNFVALISKK